MMMLFHLATKRVFYMVLPWVLFTWFQYLQVHEVDWKTRTALVEEEEQ